MSLSNWDTAESVLIKARQQPLTTATLGVEPLSMVSDTTMVALAQIPKEEVQAVTIKLTNGSNVVVRHKDG
ncbi:MAG: hypothetical protein GWN58_22875 [Anaerolineae bacterium]|nr:hypothetical protein [Thermoplasmata archaeon]NIV32219.1 hypothetical protein [Anaerolineae bacterium]NIY03671.1 hypothetical protein [Thermoplasmata archaeon]